MSTAVKICGLSEPETLRAACENGARFVGFVFYPPSPRAVTIDTAYELARQVPTGVRSVGLFVDPSDVFLDQVTGAVQLDMIQLHGNETPQRITEIKQRTHMPVMKAIRVASRDDLADLDAIERAADWILFDAKPAGADLPGGTGERFDWNILKGLNFDKPWMLSGGLDAGNAAEALSTLSPTAVDISSGVESTRGVKDASKIKDFLDTLKNI